MVGSGIEGNFNKELKDVRSKKIFRGTSADIKSFEIKSSKDKGTSGKGAAGKTEAEKVVVEKENGVWQMKEPRKYRADAAIVDSFLNAVAGLQASAVIYETKPNAAQMAKLKVAHAQTEISFVLNDGKQWSVQFGEKIGPSVNATVSDREFIYEVPATGVENLKKTGEDYRDKKLPFAFANDAAVEMLVETDGKSTEIKKNGTKWEMKVPIPDKEVYQDKAKDILNKISTAQAVKLLGKDPGKGLSQPKGHLVLKDVAGKTLLDFIWGEKLPKETTLTYAKTNLETETLAVFTSVIDDISVDRVITLKPPPVPIGTSPAASTVKRPSAGVPSGSGVPGVASVPGAPVSLVPNAGASSFNPHGLPHRPPPPPGGAKDAKK